MDLGLKNKFAIITGGTHGIGRSIAHSLAREGCHVAVCSRNESRIDQIIEEINNTGVQCIGHNVDVFEPEQISEFVSLVVKQWKTVDILVNNVGGGGRWGKESIEDTPHNVWEEVYEKNVGAAIRFTRLVLPFMRKNGWGRVVTISSLAGREGGVRPWYGMAKSAEISLMKNLAMKKELARSGITFNSVAPGGILIPDTGWAEAAEAKKDEYKKFCDDLPLGRLGTPEEVANAVTFICSDKASLINGACISVDGAEGRCF